MLLVFSTGGNDNAVLQDTEEERQGKETKAVT
jgi:hypothetical protein